MNLKPSESGDFESSDGSGDEDERVALGSSESGGGDVYAKLNESMGRGKAVTKAHLARASIAMRNQIIGKSVEGWRKVFYKIDPFAEEQYVRTSAEFHDVNIPFGILLYLVLIVYCVLLVMEHTNSKSSTTYGLIPIKEMKPIDVKIEMECDSAWGCYSVKPAWVNETIAWLDEDQYNWWRPIVINSTYTSVDKKYCNAESFVEYVRTRSAVYNTSFPICYSPNFLDGITIMVPFAADYGSESSLTIRITAPTYDNEMEFVIQMAPGQQKTIYVSQVEKQKPGKKTEYEPYVADQFYNGHGTAWDSARLMFKAQQFAYSSETHPRPSFLNIIGNVGGFSEVIVPLFAGVKFCLIPLLTWLAVLFGWSSGTGSGNNNNKAKSSTVRNNNSSAKISPGLDGSTTSTPSVAPSATETALPPNDAMKEKDIEGGGKGLAEGSE